MDSTELAELRRVTRELVDEWLRAGRFTPACDAWLRRYDLDFTKAMAARGLIGLAWPAEYGGSGRSALARLVVTEELLRAGAPVAAHWIADRQIGPSILRHGSEAAKATYLPAIAAGTATFCLGMSEPDAGSDLASVRTTASRADGGWRVTGRKIWTSHAHRATHAYVLARTGKGENRHEGLTEFIVDMAAPGVEVRPIYDLAGEHHFNEVTFDSVFVPDDHVLGTVGDGWAQVTAQLALERGGVERVLSTYPLLAAALEAAGTASAADSGTAPDAAPGTVPDADAARVGEVLARLATLRAMAVDVAAAMDAGRAPVHEAALLKDLGTTLEQDITELARFLLDGEVDPGAAGVEGLLAQGILAAPGFTVRGGTTEVLRTVIARGATGTPRPFGDGELAEVVDRVLADHADHADHADSAEADGLWRTVRDLGWTAVGVGEEHGGQGGDLYDVVTLVEGLGRHCLSLPLAETILARRALAAAGQAVTGAAEVATVVLPGPGDDLRLDAGGRLHGTVAKVPWGTHAGELVALATLGSGARALVRLAADAPGLRWTEGANLAGEPRDTLVLDGARGDVLDAPGDLLAEAALLRAAALTGALATAFARSVEHATTREQFGRPLVRFQAVANLLACLAAELESARVALRRATHAVAHGRPDARTRVAAARVIAGRAATEGARVAHQVHAAMGITREHPLHLATRRLWAWRDEFGTARRWAEFLGRTFLVRGPEHLWRWVTEDES